MTEQELDAIRTRNQSRKERKAQVSSGPWYVRNLDDDHSMNMICIVSGEDSVNLRDKAIDASIIVAETLVQYPLYVSADDEKWEENADFIANARNDNVEADIDLLLSEIERLRISD